MDNEITRLLCRRLLKTGVNVVSIGKSETQLGDLKSFSNFTFYRLDLSSKDIVRSYIYGIDTVVFFDHSSQILEKINHLFSSIMHMKSTIPRVFFISSCQVFRWIPNKIWSEEDDLKYNERVSRWQQLTNENYNKAEIIIAKQRHGPIGSIKMHFDSNYTKFSDLTTKDYDNIIE